MHCHRQINCTVTVIPEAEGPEGFDRLQRVPAFLFRARAEAPAGTAGTITRDADYDGLRGTDYSASAINCKSLRCIWRTIECTVTVIAASGYAMLEPQRISLGGDSAFNYKSSRCIWRTIEC